MVWMDGSAKVCSRCGKQKEDPGGPQLEGRQGDVGRQAAPTPTRLADSRQGTQRIAEIECFLGAVDSGQVDDWLLRRAALAENALLRKMGHAQPFDLDIREDRMCRSIAHLEENRATLKGIWVKSARRVKQLTEQLNAQKDSKRTRRAVDWTRSCNELEQATRELEEQSEQMRGLDAQLKSLKGQLEQLRGATAAEVAQTVAKENWAARLLVKNYV